MSLINLVISARAAIERRRRRNRAFAELMALDDRSLADIGIHRSEIPAVVEGVHEATHRDPAPAAPPLPAFNPHEAWLAGADRWVPRA